MRRLLCALVLCLTVLAHLSIVGRAQSSSWTIPQSALTEKSPLSPTPDVLKKGRALFASSCQKCHGPEGKGDGPDGDREEPPADLTLASRSAANLDGIVFYKIWNGRARPKMPAFKSQLTKDQIWTIVEYVKTLRKPSDSGSTASPVQ
jgi:mono/diheme cytochrome c family protein